MALLLHFDQAAHPGVAVTVQLFGVGARSNLFFWALAFKCVESVKSTAPDARPCSPFLDARMSEIPNRILATNR